MLETKETRNALRGSGRQEDGLHQLDDLLAQAIDTVAGDGAEGALKAVRDSLSGLAQRLRERRFHLAVLGQFKRGKSTLLNALLGESLLPTAVVPLTAIPTFLRAGKQLVVKVTYLDNRAPREHNLDCPEDASEMLRELVTEEANPQNRLGIAAVEVMHPSPFLAQGVVLIDTPGIGSTLRHNTEATLRFLPQCDAALFVVSADPPLTDAEAQFLSEVERSIARLFVVFNKTDYLDREELDAAIGFLRGALIHRGGLVREAPIFAVSARRGVRARAEENESLWAESGLKAVEEHLLGFLTKHKNDALAEAVTSKAVDVLGEAVLTVKLMQRSLELPLEDLERRLRVFEAKMEEVSAERIGAAACFAALPCCSEAGDATINTHLLCAHAHKRMQYRAYGSVPGGSRALKSLQLP
ncbi:MAG: dynamin family protein [Bacillota bacterium]|nr:dynamin family protein [Bacillota bacterium]